MNNRKYQYGKPLHPAKTIFSLYINKEKKRMFSPNNVIDKTLASNVVQISFPSVCGILTS